MTFLQVRPYVKLGVDLSIKLETDNGVVTGKVTQDVVNKVQASSLIKLNVIDTPKVTRNLKFPKEQTFVADGKSAFTYSTSGDAGYTFKVKCLIRKKDVLKDGKTVFYYLNYYYTNRVAMSVVIDTEIVPNGVYRISDFTEYAPIRKDYYEIEIEFTKHTSVSAKLTNKCTVLQSYLKQCKRPSDKVYTKGQIDASKKGKPKKVTYKVKDKKTGKMVKKTKTIKPVASSCIAYVNQVLMSKGKYPKKTYKKYGSYWTKSSHNALKRFQKKWNKQGLKPKVNEKGKLSKNCWEAIKRYTEVK